MAPSMSADSGAPHMASAVRMLPTTGSMKNAHGVSGPRGLDQGERAQLLREVLGKGPCERERRGHADDRHDRDVERDAVLDREQDLGGVVGIVVERVVRRDHVMDRRPRCEPRRGCPGGRAASRPAPGSSRRWTRRAPSTCADSRASPGSCARRPWWRGTSRAAFMFASIIVGRASMSVHHVTPVGDVRLAILPCIGVEVPSAAAGRSRVYLAVECERDVKLRVPAVVCERPRDLGDASGPRDPAETGPTMLHGQLAPRPLRGRRALPAARSACRPRRAPGRQLRRPVPDRPGTGS